MISKMNLLLHCIDTHIPMDKREEDMGEVGCDPLALFSYDESDAF